MISAIFDPRAREDLFAIPSDDQDRIETAILIKLTRFPELYGRRLRGKLAELWRMRVGDYRVIYKIDTNTIVILTIGNRKNIYSIADRRLG